MFMGVSSGGFISANNTPKHGETVQEICGRESIERAAG
jgi:hypothetical protein